MIKFHRDAILSNLSVLVEETDLYRLVPELQKRNVFNERMINRILNPSHNLKRQKTDLYTEILKRGPQAFANLQKALESSNHFKLAQLLKNIDLHNDNELQETSYSTVNSNRSQGTADNDGGCISIINSESSKYRVIDSGREKRLPMTSGGYDRSARFRTQNLQTALEKDLKNDLSSEALVDSNCKMFKYPAYMKKWEEAFESSEFPFTNNVIICSNERFLPVKVKPSEKFKEYNANGPPVYKMDSDPRGLALIINNINFNDQEEYKTRCGADNDEYRLKLLLEQLNFVVEVHQNKTRNEMLQITHTFSGREELYECDSVIVTFMSHGEEGDTEDNSKVVGVDGLGVAISDIISFFYNDSCKALINKPKIFFFQACRGVLEDPGVLMETLIPRSRIEKDGRQVRLPSEKNKIRSQSDIFIACPVPPGKKANRDRVTGTWFIQTIVEVFSEHAWNTHLEDMMKMVDLNIKNTNNFYTSNFQALTTKTIGWNKNLYFNPGIAKDKITGATIRIGNNHNNSYSDDEEMDIVDSGSEMSKKNCPPNSPISNYSKLKEDKEGECDENKRNGCYNFLGCTAI